MKKEEFLKLIYARLIERGIDKATAEKETSHVRTYLDESGTEEINVSLDEMVEGIISMLDSGKEKKAIKRRTPKAKPIADDSKANAKDETKKAQNPNRISKSLKPLRTRELPKSPSEAFFIG
jgi:hypothetical protein